MRKSECRAVPVMHSLIVAFYTISDSLLKA